MFIGLISLLRFAVNFYKYNIGCGGDNLSDFAVIRWLISPNGGIADFQYMLTLAGLAKSFGGHGA